ncbi:hypothetical protein EON63_05950 [archaeon]|nr:MAG: hypothetical protein EON63_05950 [archaeon]
MSSTVFSCLSSTFSSPPTSTAASFNGKPPAVFVPQLVFHLGSSRKVLSTLAAIQGMVYGVWCMVYGVWFVYTVHSGNHHLYPTFFWPVPECRSDEEISLDTGRDSQTSTARQTVSIHHMSSAASHASLPAREIVLPDIVYGMLYDGYGYEYGNGVEGGDGYGHGYGHVNGQDDGDGDSDDDGDDDNSIDISSLPVQQDSL